MASRTGAAIAVILVLSSVASLTFLPAVLADTTTTTVPADGGRPDWTLGFGKAVSELAKDIGDSIASIFKGNLTAPPEEQPPGFVEQLRLVMDSFLSSLMGLKLW